MWRCEKHRAVVERNRSRAPGAVGALATSAMNGRSVPLFAMPRRTRSDDARVQREQRHQRWLARSQRRCALRHVTAASCEHRDRRAEHQQPLLAQRDQRRVQALQVLARGTVPRSTRFGRPSVITRISTPATASSAALSDNAQPASLRGPSPGSRPMTSLKQQGPRDTPAGCTPSASRQGSSRKKIVPMNQTTRSRRRGRMRHSHHAIAVGSAGSTAARRRGSSGSM